MLVSGKLNILLKSFHPKYVGMEVLVTELESRKCPIDAQVSQSFKGKFSQIFCQRLMIGKCTFLPLTS